MKKIRNQKGGFNLGTIINVLVELTCSTSHDTAVHIWKEQREKATKRFGSFKKLWSWVNNYLYARPDIFTRLTDRDEGGIYTLTEEGKSLSQDLKNQDKS